MQNQIPRYTKKCLYVHETLTLNHFTLELLEQHSKDGSYFYRFLHEEHCNKEAKQFPC